MPAVIEEVAMKLISRNESLAVAESCTGGWVAKVCTDLSGSSRWFDCGFVTYSNNAKEHMLGVNVVTIESNGAVSQQTVEEMALGALKNSQAQWSLAISGVAGPDGGTEINPVGSVWFAWAYKNDVMATSKQCFDGDRDAVRNFSVDFALNELLKLLK